MSSSTNLDLALAVDSTYFLLSFCDLEDSPGIHSAMICPDPTAIVCEYVDSATLCQYLDLKDERNLVDISIFCGNQFTAHLNVTCKKLGLASSSFGCVSSWVATLDPEEWPCIIEGLHLDPVYCEAISQSFELYAPYCDDSGSDSGSGNAPAGLIQKPTVWMQTTPSSKLRQGYVTLLYFLLAMVCTEVACVGACESWSVLFPRSHSSPQEKNLLCSRTGFNL